ncbi:hypothetical protein AB4Y63_09795 [Leifsonia sp. YAF41]|uniref:hypothetical protein n=1 Tax=Leifsonia sp. YAF41 TaxID=3233086 RepID=UPI003F99074C
MPIIETRGSRLRGGRTGLALFAAIGLVAALSACTAGSPSGGSADAGELKSGNEQAAFEDWQHDFTSCMKDEGVEMGSFAVTSVDGASGGLDDDSESSGSTMTTQEGDFDIKEYEAASKVCTKKLGEMPIPPGMPSPEEMQESMLKFAKCMREAGYDYPDPEVSKGGGITIKAMPADEYDPAVMDSCSEESGSPMMQMKAEVGGE